MRKTSEPRIFLLALQINWNLFRQSWFYTAQFSPLKTHSWARQGVKGFEIRRCGSSAWLQRVAFFWDTLYSPAMCILNTIHFKRSRFEYNLVKNLHSTILILLWVATPQCREWTSACEGFIIFFPQKRQGLLKKAKKGI